MLLKLKSWKLQLLNKCSLIFFLGDIDFLLLQLFSFNLSFFLLLFHSVLLIFLFCLTKETFSWIFFLELKSFVYIGIFLFNLLLLCISSFKKLILNEIKYLPKKNYMALCDTLIYAIQGMDNEEAKNTLIEIASCYNSHSRILEPTKSV